MKWEYTTFAQARRPRWFAELTTPARQPWGCRATPPLRGGESMPAISHSRIGTVKPVLGREKTSSGRGQSGAWSIILLFGGCPFPIHFPVERSNSISTSGTRISSEWAIPAQSESRRSWLRMYQQDSKHASRERGGRIEA